MLTTNEQALLTPSPSPLVSISVQEHVHAYASINQMADKLFT